jgi:hypothetical protein
MDVALSRNRERAVIWFFERESANLRYEIRHALEGAGYELVIVEDTNERVEQINSASLLLERSRNVWSRLVQQGWRPLGPEPPPTL